MTFVMVQIVMVPLPAVQSTESSALSQCRCAACNDETIMLPSPLLVTAELPQTRIIMIITHSSKCARCVGPSPVSSGRLVLSVFVGMSVPQCGHANASRAANHHALHLSD